MSQAGSGPLSGNGGNGCTEYINLEVKVVGDDVISYCCTVLKSIRMEKIKKRYSEAMYVPIKRIRFVFGSRDVSDDETPEMLDMKNDDIILAYHDKS